jgi:hypothetical protein
MGNIPTLLTTSRTTGLPGRVMRVSQEIGFVETSLADATYSSRSATR